MNDGQRAHIVERFAAGATAAEMVDYLTAEGVDETTARQAVSEVAQTELKLPAISDLVRESWEFTTTRIDLVGWYLLVSLVPLFLIGVPILLAVIGGAGELPALLYGAGLLGVVGFVAYLWFVIIATSGLLYVVAEANGSLRFIDGWRWAKPRFWQLAWLGVLFMLAITAGLFALVIPALVISLYGMFYLLTYIEHDHRGLHALAASAHMVHGRFWPILGRLAAVWLLLMVATLAVSVVFEVFAELSRFISEWLPTLFIGVGEVLSTLVSLVLTVTFMRYLVLLYSAVATQTVPYQVTPHTTGYTVFRILAWVGLVISVIGTLLISFIVAEGVRTDWDEYDRGANYSIEEDYGYDDFESNR